jgi:D-inositol-3-phosphate glycosyltransferase
MTANGDALALPSGFIDAPGPGDVLARGPMTLSGWALLPSGPPTRVELWLGDVALGPARLGGHRPDVAQHLGPDAMIAGWEHLVDVAGLDGLEGEVAVRALALGRDGERHELPPAVAFLAPAVRRRVPSARPPAVADEPGDGPQVVVFTHRLDLGGGQLILQDLLLALLATTDLRFTVVAPSDGPLRAPLEAAGIPVHVAGAIPLDDPDLYAARVDELAAWVERGGFAAALVNTSVAFAGADAALRAGVPALWAIHESYTPATLWRVAFPDIHPDVVRRADAALRAAQVAIFEAEATRRQYAAAIDGTCLTLPYGLDLRALERARGTFDAAAVRRERAIPADARVVVAVGTVEPRKAQIPLVQAFGQIADRHPDALLVLIGARADAYGQALRDYVDRCAWKGQVRVHGLISDTWPWYGLADLMVCASDLESLPRSVLEAMWWETPVVATAVFGLPDLIDHGRSGWLCAPRDVGALATALDAALSTPTPGRAAIAAAGRAVVQERHGLGEYAARCDDLLRRVMAHGSVKKEWGAGAL